MTPQTTLRIDVVDVSGWQTPPLDWDAARAAGIEGVYVKQTEGSTHESPSWLTHAQQAKAAGLKVGVYHLAWPNTPIDADATREANELIKNVRQLEDEGVVLELLPALDLEKGKRRLKGSQLLQWAATFCDRVCAQLQIPRMLIYANRSYVRRLNRGAEKMGTNLGLGRHLLWIAGDSADVPAGIWQEAVLWQTPRREVSWYNGTIDCDQSIHGIGILCLPKANKPTRTLQTALSEIAQQLADVEGHLEAIDQHRIDADRHLAEAHQLVSDLWRKSRDA